MKYNEINKDVPFPLTIKASDGFKLGAYLWTNNSEKNESLVIINPATSVRCRYYFRFAEYLYEKGFNVITYDYRGIGESRPADLRGLNAGWTDWGLLDFEAVLQYAAGQFPGQPVHVVAHSVGGFILGFARSASLISRIFTMGAQYACWRDYAPGSKLKMWAKWHIAMPLITMLYGYFPGKRLGWMEDTPRGVVYDWVLSSKRFDQGNCNFTAYGSKTMTGKLDDRFGNITAPILAVSVTDDQFGTIPAIERLLKKFTGSSRMHLRISPDMIDEQQIGHFGFFNSYYKDRLWYIAAEWLGNGKLPDGCPGERIITG